MKKLYAVLMLGGLFCCFFSGCHTARMVSRFDTGRVNGADIWDSIVLDDMEFQENYW